mmetsp:Transcript_7114/g.17077  ORF Transcript_7114/g.17077 Transcript_7114/m.17077 type:complete len:186 (+) Transcript_7114:604-1161(+)
MPKELFDATHDVLKHTNIDRLWFKTNPALKIQYAHSHNSSMARLSRLPTELLVNVVAELELDDELSFALSCCSLRHAVVAARDGGRARSTTRICSVLGSPQKLAWAISCGLPMDIACRRAANGVLDALVVLRHQGFELPADTCRRAAQGWHLAVIQWARANGYEWDSETCAAAARGGDFSADDFA